MVLVLDPGEITRSLQNTEYHLSPAQPCPHPPTRRTSATAPLSSNMNMRLFWWRVNMLGGAGALHYSWHQWVLGLGWANILRDSHSSRRKYYIQGKLFIAFKLNAYWMDKLFSFLHQTLKLLNIGSKARVYTHNAYFFWSEKGQLKPHSKFPFIKKITDHPSSYEGII